VTVLPARFRTGREDDGVTLVLAALVLTGLLTITALVVDLGYVRASARADQSIADLAALAGAEKLEEERYVEACEDMIDYLNRNANGMPAIEASGFCGPMGSTTCTDGALAQAAPTTTSGKYTVTIEFPVPDEAGDYPAIGAGLEDGVPCDRMRVTVSSVEPTFFGGVVGASEYEVTRSATLRAGPGESAKAPALWLLEPYGCNALETGGANTSIIVGDMAPTPTLEDPFPEPIEGLITVDSDGTRSGGSNGCSGNSVTINVSQGRVHALPITQPANPDHDIGEIRAFAVSRWATECVVPACTAADVSAGRLAPQPTHVPRRATRAPVDHRWNCRTGYDPYDVGAGAGFPGLEIPDCPYVEEPAKGETQPRAPYIDKLRTLVGTSGAPTGAGFSTYPRPLTTDSCNVSGDVVLPAGNWFVDCPTLTVSGGNSITFTGGNVITRGGISSTGTGAVTFNANNPVENLAPGCTPLPAASLCSSSSAKASWVYMRAGDLDIKGPFSAFKTMVYFHNGAIKLTGGGSFTWTAPTEGPFAGLAAWAEKPDAYQITGGGTVTMAGAFFTPFANSMNISGGGIWNVKEAQYISRRLSASGGAILTMAPNPVTALTLPPKEGFLIR
jgi:hypothetical protein